MTQKITSNAVAVGGTDKRITKKKIKLFWVNNEMMNKNWKLYLISAPISTNSPIKLYPKMETEEENIYIYIYETLQLGEELASLY